jgi:hypothetical protein
VGDFFDADLRRFHADSRFFLPQIYTDEHRWPASITQRLGSFDEIFLTQITLISNVVIASETKCSAATQKAELICKRIWRGIFLGRFTSFAMTRFVGAAKPTASNICVHLCKSVAKNLRQSVAKKACVARNPSGTLMGIALLHPSY